MTDELSVETVHRFGLVLDDLGGARDELNRLDGAAGDGDLGITIAAGAAALRTILPELEGSELSPALRRCGMELARHAPSTAGTLIATALIAASRVVPEGVGGGALLAAVLEAGRQSIEQRGRAKPGDKTMLDALVPAIEALRELSGASVAEALSAAADGAAAGAEATRELEPRVGRGAWLADRSRGNVDAGAHLVAFALRAAADRAR